MQNNLSDLQSLLERLKGATGPDRIWRRDLRERIARIIDPAASMWIDRRNAALPKADQILALLQALIVSKSPSEPSA